MVRRVWGFPRARVVQMLTEGECQPGFLPAPVPLSLKQGLIMQRWLAWNSRRTPDCLHTLSVSAPCTAGHVYTTVPGLIISCFVLKTYLFLFDVQEYFCLRVCMGTT